MRISDDTAMLWWDVNEQVEKIGDHDVRMECLKYLETLVTTHLSDIPTESALYDVRKLLVTSLLEQWLNSKEVLSSKPSKAWKKPVSSRRQTAKKNPNATG